MKSSFFCGLVYSTLVTLMILLLSVSDAHRSYTSQFSKNLDWIDLQSYMLEYCLLSVSLHIFPSLPTVAVLGFLGGMFSRILETFAIRTGMVKPQHSNSLSLKVGTILLLAVPAAFFVCTVRYIFYSPLWFQFIQYDLTREIVTGGILSYYAVTIASMMYLSHHRRLAAHVMALGNPRNDSLEKNLQ